MEFQKICGSGQEILCSLLLKQTLLSIVGEVPKVKRDNSSVCVIEWSLPTKNLKPSHGEK